MLFYMQNLIGFIISVVLLLVAFSQCFFKHIVWLFATLLGFFQRENLGAYVVATRISCFSSKIETKLAKSKTNLRYLKKQQVNARSNREGLEKSLTISEKRMASRV